MTTSSPLGPMVTTTVLAVGDKLPDPVLANITQLGGWLVFLVDFLAAMHLIYLVTSVVLQHLGDRPLPVPPGQWFTKLVAGIWICAAAGSISAIVIGT